MARSSKQRKTTILAVDDEPDFLELVEELLSFLPVTVRTAVDPEKALTLLEQEHADVMLVDLQMPKGGGRRLLSEARQRFPDVYSIVVTAYGSEAIAVEMLKELGANGYLSKTNVDDESLDTAIRHAMRSRRADVIALANGFEILSEEGEDLCTLYPLGYLSAQPALRRLPLLAKAVDHASEVGKKNILIDLTHLSSAAAVAMGYVLSATKRHERKGGRLAICGANHIVSRALLSLNQPDQPERGLPVFGDYASAFKALQGSNSP